jgi:hypothetical protein
VWWGCKGCEAEARTAAWSRRGEGGGSLMYVCCIASFSSMPWGVRDNKTRENIVTECWCMQLGIQHSVLAPSLVLLLRLRSVLLPVLLGASAGLVSDTHPRPSLDFRSRLHSWPQIG